jgi:hypothetical protein
MMKALLIVTAVIESATGTALLTAPALVCSVLLGGSPGALAGLVVARMAGAALLALGIVCGSGSRDTLSRATVGIVAAMLLYNLAAVVLLVSARLCLGMAGMGLLPVAVLHAALAAWCIVCLRPVRSQG